jgi:hypothetical protein
MSGKSKIGALLVGLAGVGVALFLQEGVKNRLSTENAELRNQLSQVTFLQDSNQALSELLLATIQSGQSNQQELLRLRGQGVRLRQLERENGQLKAQTDQLQRQIAERQRQQESAAAVKTPPATSPPATPPTETDLGPLELANGVATRFDLGGGTNCVVTPAALADGTIMTRLSLVLNNADGTTTELGQGRITAAPGQHGSLSVGDRMIGLAVTVKSQ